MAVVGFAAALALALLPAAPLRAAASDVSIPNPEAQKSNPVPASAPSVLGAEDAVILGVVEGVTEYLPVSSTGHLIVANRVLGLDGNLPVRDAAGREIWLKPPSAKHPGGIPLTPKLAADTFAVIIQFGAISAVALLYWAQLLAMLNGLLGRDPAGRRLLRNVLVAFVPAAVVGLLAHDFIEEKLFSVPAVIVALVAGALLMWWAERRAKRADAQSKIQIPNSQIGSALAPDSAASLSLAQAAGIGALQCLALWPGTSRSMTAIVGARLAGLGPRAAAEFSFLLGLVTLTAAASYKSYSSGAAMIAVFGWPHILLGCTVAAVTAALSVKFLVNWLVRHGLMVFVWYRLAFAALLAVLLAAGYL
jgi:undecaprenyl-diphosphatase